MRLPDGVLGMASRGPDWARWVDGLSRRLDGLLEEWELAIDGSPIGKVARKATGR